MDGRRNLVVENRDEMYSGAHQTSLHPWIILTSMDKMAPSMDGHTHQWYATCAILPDFINVIL